MAPSDNPSLTTNCVSLHESPRSSEGHTYVRSIPFNLSCFLYSVFLFLQIPSGWALAKIFYFTFLKLFSAVGSLCSCGPTRNDHWKITGDTQSLRLTGFLSFTEFLVLPGSASGPTGFVVMCSHNSDLTFLGGNNASSGALHPFTEIIIFKAPESSYIIQGKWNIHCWISKADTTKFWGEVMVSC